MPADHVVDQTPNNEKQIVLGTAAKSTRNRVDDDFPSPSFLDETCADDQAVFWEQWVPMEKTLFCAVQYLHLCMVQKVDELLTSAGIEYWICGGTLLGALRHGGCVPHDDDVDVECFGKDFDKIAAIPVEPPFYTGFDPTGGGKWEGHTAGKLYFFRGEFGVDVFQRESGLSELPHFPSRTEVFPLQRYTFHNVQVWGPNAKNCKTYLDRLYGKDWRTTVCIWNHDYNWYHGADFCARKTVLALDEYNRIVANAGIVSPRAENCAAATYQVFCRKYGDDFYERYENYRNQRVWRRNRAAAEWRESHQR